MLRTCVRVKAAKTSAIKTSTILILNSFKITSKVKSHNEYNISNIYEDRIGVRPSPCLGSPVAQHTALIDSVEYSFGGPLCAWLWGYFSLYPIPELEGSWGPVFVNSDLEYTTPRAAGTLICHLVCSHFLEDVILYPKPPSPHLS